MPVNTLDTLLIAFILATGKPSEMLIGATN